MLSLYPIIARSPKTTSQSQKQRDYPDFVLTKSRILDFAEAKSGLHSNQVGTRNDINK